MDYKELISSFNCLDILKVVSEKFNSDFLNESPKKIDELFYRLSVFDKSCNRNKFLYILFMSGDVINQNKQNLLLEYEKGVDLFN